ncbi:Piso0_005049 [Millerozyma farinosa CBS 7064]|uniref:Pyridoxal phosphate homeostasis protein n=1 Tax=Pichia sorbitophila (strain ATCC MYA-4447 / BCRC 22081 / CBS 7064 / NBRC 10061 / NRRL Y-12695) TaxID=559304 RepID=G8Y435_PICSO|nr:Piso0_005049 [Millerozyma farinosa CBS 7064]
MMLMIYKCKCVCTSRIISKVTVLILINSSLAMSKRILPIIQHCTHPRVLIRQMSSSLSYAPERKQELVQNYENIRAQVEEYSRQSKNDDVTLVAVSKLKPASDIQALYDHGVRHFGENYVQELVGKAKVLPMDIKWHFIGGLQTGKCKDLSKNISNLYSVKAVDTLKKCQKLNDTRKSANGSVIEVYLQINTSGEEQKSGFSLHDKSELFATIDYFMSGNASYVNLKGLMTIGSFSESLSGEENSDFKKLRDLKSELEEKFNLKLELSMGMSNDFKDAIIQGSNEVRVGTSIFGTRPTKS